MIRSFGLHWSVDQVWWGSRGHPATLKGAQSRSPKAPSHSFREMTGIYALYADYELVYLGQSGRSFQKLFYRLKAHRKDHLAERWNRFSFFGINKINKNGSLSIDITGIHNDVDHVLNDLEAVCIAISEPRLNLQRGQWKEARQYFQYRSPELDKSYEADFDEDMGD